MTHDLGRDNQCRRATGPVRFRSSLPVEVAMSSIELFLAGAVTGYLVALGMVFYIQLRE